MYRDDDIARAERASALIDEIADLERQRVTRAALDHRLEAARRELRELQPAAPPAPDPETHPSLATHLLVFAATAAAAFLGYGLLF
jgi:hypothetical protein